MRADVTLVGIEGRENYSHMLNICRVLQYCASLVPFKPLLLSYLEPPSFYDGEWIQIPVLDHDAFSIFEARCLHRFVDTNFSMTVHCDGFILNSDNWTDDFLAYDFVGAPWEFGTGRKGSAPTIGNGGFCIRSRRFFCHCERLPWQNKLVNGDAFYCLHHRGKLEKAGITFAPAAVAERFSCEATEPVEKLFGFHRNAELRAEGWKRLLAFETTK